jgi:hypothetical protein
MIYVKELAEIIVKQGLMMEALQRDISEVVKQRDEHKYNENTNVAVVLDNGKGE